MSTDQKTRRVSFARASLQGLPAPICEQWSWQALGRCREHPAELFFPEEESRRTRRALEDRAKRICQDCPVLAECRAHALKTPETYGVWGAMTAAERARH
jgi:WhiB family transcriptional regulator, redox-sensing transcriptional regulator